MTPINLIELIPRCHEAAKAKGFWDVERNEAEALMLVVSELCEAMEADRKGHHADLQTFAAYRTEGLSNEAFAKVFQDWIKDTVADEIADAYIRLCDFVGGFAEHFDTDGLTQWLALRRAAPVDLPANFGAALLDITGYVPMLQDWESKARPHIRAAANIAVRLEALCAKRGIDLATHIDLKLRFNATRGRLHNKLY